MLFDIRQVTTCRYDRPVQLAPHILRLTPRSDGKQRLLDFGCTVSPQPVVQSNALDAEGNLVVRLWFDGATSTLNMAFSSRTETLLENPYGYLADSAAIVLPMSCLPEVTLLLAACRDPGRPASIVARLVTTLLGQAQYDTLVFPHHTEQLPVQRNRA